MAKFLTLVAFVVVIVGLGALIGTSFPIGEWYENLNKPFFNPPPSVFGIVWPMLYVKIAVVGWRFFVSEGRIPGWGAWVGQMILNFAWSPLFFGAHQIFWGMWVIAATLALAVSFVTTTWHEDRFASVLFLPYCAWLSFALLLNVAFWIIN
ncbi:MAG: TspO/MBR family protein [Pseudomonadota bacterium]